mgnify:CR=1 FL=1
MIRLVIKQRKTRTYMTILLIASLTMFTFFTYCAVVAYYQMFKEDFGDL